MNINKNRKLWYSNNSVKIFSHTFICNTPKSSTSDLYFNINSLKNTWRTVEDQFALLCILFFLVYSHLCWFKMPIQKLYFQYLKLKIFNHYVFNVIFFCVMQIIIYWAITYTNCHVLKNTQFLYKSKRSFILVTFQDKWPKKKSPPPPIYILLSIERIHWKQAALLLELNKLVRVLNDELC